MAGEERPAVGGRSVAGEDGGKGRQRMSLGEALLFVTRYWLSGSREVRRLFDEAAFERIEAAIGAGEGGHRGEIRFALESDLTLDDARRCSAPRERALAAFAQHGIWDTEENSGILIFLQWPLHAVEIVVDRGVCRSIDDAVWQQAIDRIVTAARDRRPVDGVVEAIELIHAALAKAMPARAGDVDQLPNRPIRL